MSLNLDIGKKLVRHSFEVTKRFDEVFEEQWKTRLKRDPYNKKVPYKSRTDFYRYNFKVLFLMATFDYDFLISRMNPDHKDFPEENIE